VQNKAGNSRPAVAYLPIGRLRLAKAGGRPELDLALAEVLEGEGVLAEASGRLLSTQRGDSRSASPT